MFGSSQDRAKQLAGRKRRERIHSLSSSTSHRSISSSSQASQQGPASSHPQDDMHHSPIIEEPSPMDACGVTSFRDTPVSSTTQVTTQFLTAQQRSQVEHQRLQAEYLSHVLYDSPSMSALHSSPISGFGSPSRHVRYGSLGTQLATTHRLRNITNPALQNQSQSVHSGTFVPLLPRPSAFASHLQSQTAVTLRGGSGQAAEGEEPSHDEAVEQVNQIPYQFQHPRDMRPAPIADPGMRIIPSRPYAFEFEWVTEVFRLPQWMCPIFSGVPYDTFLASLDMSQSFQFRMSFRQKDWQVARLELTKRRTFFQCLSPMQKLLFKNIILMRGSELVALTKGVSQKLPLLAPGDGWNPLAIDLQLMLEATESYTQPARRPIHPVNLRSTPPPGLLPRAGQSNEGKTTSAPNLGQQQDEVPGAEYKGYYPQLHNY
jgi:hypothetical protein